jgi:hypothetical protein
MAIMCNIDTKLTTNEIIQKINEKIDELNNNREKQKIKDFKYLVESDKNIKSEFLTLSKQTKRRTVII